MTDLKVNRIYKGDCVDLLRKLKPESIDMVFADPPYNLSGKTFALKGNKTGGDWTRVNEKWDVYSNEDYQQFSDSWVIAAGQSLRNSGSIYICCSQHNIEAVLQSLRKAKCSVNNIIVWQKPNPMPNVTRRLFTHSVEFVVWAVRGKGWTFNASELRAINPDKQKDGSEKMMRDVWVFPVVQGSERVRDGSGKALHPTQKPLELVRRTIVASSKPGDLVLDPFMGSGTTAVAAIQEGRDWIGFEADSTYIQAARNRIKATERN
jgi:site-specific DNA-methyltransferase (adenine-specific)/modification methylase